YASCASTVGATPCIYPGSPGWARWGGGENRARARSITGTPLPSVDWKGTFILKIWRGQLPSIIQPSKWAATNFTQLIKENHYDTQRTRNGCLWVYFWRSGGRPGGRCRRPADGASFGPGNEIDAAGQRHRTQRTGGDHGPRDSRPGGN